MELYTSVLHTADQLALTHPESDVNRRHILTSIANPCKPAPFGVNFDLIADLYS